MMASSLNVKGHRRWYFVTRYSWVRRQTSFNRACANCTTSELDERLISFEVLLMISFKTSTPHICKIVQKADLSCCKLMYVPKKTFGLLKTCVVHGKTAIKYNLPAEKKRKISFVGYVSCKQAWTGARIATWCWEWNPVRNDELW